MKRDVRITVLPWFADHAVDGRAVLPAVESLLLLALETEATLSHLDPLVMFEARFARFLELPAGAEYIEGVIELLETEDDSVRATLSSRRKVGAFFRQVEHAAVSFRPPGEHLPCNEIGGTAVAESEPFIVTGERVYAELIPFGRAYRNLLSVEIREDGAVAALATPALSLTDGAGKFGSPFLLDGALHAACVWGQRYGGFVPFPVGFAVRRICIPARPGGSYRATVRVEDATGEELVVDIDIANGEGTTVEQVRGLRMRDISGGRMQPPQWIKSSGRESGAC